MCAQPALFLSWHRVWPMPRPLSRGYSQPANRERGLPLCRGYLLTQVLGGVWADKYGAKRVLGFAVVWWSMATILTPIAA